MRVQASVKSKTFYEIKVNIVLILYIWRIRILVIAEHFQRQF